MARAPVVDALQALRGVSFVTAVGLVAEIGDIRRFDHPRQLMAFLGLVPSEYSSGPSVRRGGITKAGNPHARRLLAEAAWAYQGVPRIGRQMLFASWSVMVGCNHGVGCKCLQLTREKLRGVFKEASICGAPRSAHEAGAGKCAIGCAARGPA